MAKPAKELVICTTYQNVADPTDELTKCYKQGEPIAIKLLKGKKCTNMLLVLILKQLIVVVVSQKKHTHTHKVGFSLQRAGSLGIMPFLVPFGQYRRNHT